LVKQNKMEEELHKMEENKKGQGKNPKGEQKNPNNATPKKKLNFKLSMQEVVIIILLISYIFIFYAYKHDMEQIQSINQQYKDIVENPQRLCYQYYEYLNQQSINQGSGPKNLSELFEGLIISDSNG